MKRPCRPEAGATARARRAASSGRFALGEKRRQPHAAGRARREVVLGEKRRRRRAHAAACRRCRGAAARAVLYTPVRARSRRGARQAGPSVAHHCVRPVLLPRRRRGLAAAAAAAVALLHVPYDARPQAECQQAHGDRAEQRQRDAAGAPLRRGRRAGRGPLLPGPCAHGAGEGAHGMGRPAWYDPCKPAPTAARARVRLLRATAGRVGRPCSSTGSLPGLSGPLR